MASFFQPAVFDPNLSGDGDARASSTRFLVYSNSILPKSTLLATWYQYVVFGIGAAFFCIPLLRWALLAIIGTARGRKKRKWVENTPAAPKVDLPSWTNKSASPSGPIRSVKSFGVFFSGDVASFLDIDYDLHIVDFGTCMGGLPAPQTQAGENGVWTPVVRNIWGLVGSLDWHAVSSSEPTLLQSIDALKSIAAGQGLSGLVISSTIDVEQNLLEILDLLVYSGVPCMLLDDASEPTRGVDLTHLFGVIYQNACILPDGSRRDFFQASKLRNGLGKCEKRRAKSKDFFVGFFDRWTTRPIPAVIRRGFKLAQFYGAILNHAPVGEREWNGSNAGNCLSAFDWIKRADIIMVRLLHT